MTSVRLVVESLGEYVSRHLIRREVAHIDEESALEITHVVAPTLEVAGAAGDAV